MAESFGWRWTLIGAVLMVAGAVGLYHAGRPILDDVFVRHGALAGAALMAGGGLLVYFLGALLVGRMSSGATVKEPAVAAVLALVVVTGLQFTAGMINVIGLLLGAPLCFAVAYLGGSLGERWQRQATRRRE